MSKSRLQRGVGTKGLKAGGFTEKVSEGGAPLSHGVAPLDTGISHYSEALQAAAWKMLALRLHPQLRI